MARDQTKQSWMGSLSLASILVIVSGVLAFGAPLYLLGQVELQRLFRLAYQLDRDTAWYVSSLAPQQIAVREALLVALPSLGAAVIALGVALAITFTVAFCIQRRRDRGTRVTDLFHLRRTSTVLPSYSPGFYAGLFALIIVLYFLYYFGYFALFGLYNAPNWAPETAAPWWAPAVAGTIAGVGTAVFAYAIARNVSTLQWGGWALFLIYLPALFTSYFSSVSKTSAINAISLPIVTLCITSPTPTSSPSGSNSGISASKATALWGDYLTTSNGSWYLLVDKWISDEPKNLTAPRFPTHYPQGAIRWHVDVTDELVAIPQGSISRIIFPNHLPASSLVDPSAICHESLPYLVPH